MSCSKCRWGREFQAADIADMQLSWPRLFTQPIDRVMERFVCKRCGKGPSLLTIERPKPGGFAQVETVLQLARG